MQVRLCSMLLLVLASQPAWATEVGAVELYRAKRAYEQGRYEECLVHARRSLEAPGLDRDSKAQTLMYEGLCHYGIGQSERGIAAFRGALTEDPSLRLPRLTSPKLVDLFEYLRPERQERPPTPPTDSPRRQPSLAPAPSPPPPALVQPPRHPPEVSRPHGSHHWPWTAALGGAALAGAGVGLAFGVEARSLEQQSNAASFQDDAHRLASRSRQYATAANVAFAAAGALALGTVLQFVLWN